MVVSVVCGRTGAGLCRLDLGLVLDRSVGRFNAGVVRRNAPRGGSLALAAALVCLFCLFTDMMSAVSVPSAASTGCAYHANKIVCKDARM